MKKHIGKLKESGTTVVVVFMKLPDEPENCLVVDADSLSDQMRTELLNVINSEEGQNSRSIHDLLYRRMFRGGTSILEELHQTRSIMKRRTDEVIMMPDNYNQIPLNELNDAMSRVESKTDHMSDEQLQERKNTYKQRIEERETSEREQIGKNLIMEADDLDAQAQMMVSTAKQKREQAKDYLPQPKQQPKTNTKSTPNKRQSKKDIADEYTGNKEVGSNETQNKNTHTKATSNTSDQ